MADVFDTQPLITLVIAPTGGPEEASDFLDSLGTLDPDLVELILSPSDGRASVQAWNEGLHTARGHWIGFVASSDRAESGYLDELVTVLSAAPDDCVVVSTEVAYVDAESGLQLNTHPLRKRFGGGSRFVDLRDEPLVIPVDAVGVFVRVSAVRTTGVGFDPVLSPYFADRHFLSKLLLSQDSPRLGLVKGARYLQRRVMDGKVAVAIDPTNAGRFIELVTRGYLDLLRQVEPTPPWLIGTVINDLRWYVVSDRRRMNGFRELSGDMLRKFGDDLSDVISRIGVDAIRDYDQTPLDDQDRERMMALGPNASRPMVLKVVEVDSDQSLDRIVYSFSGPTPVEKFSAEGTAIIPAYCKSGPLAVLGADRMSQRTIWIDHQPGIKATIDGNDVPIAPLPSATPTTDTPRSRWVFGRSKRRPSKFAQAWILMDRATLAGDNAEHLFRYLVNERPEINAWFVLDQTSPDWERLEAEGFRLVKYGSPDHQELLAEAIHYASSHIDPYVYDPFGTKSKSTPSWKFTFLQHGVTKDDVSDWFNGKRIDRLVTATYGEHESIVGDGSRYRFTEHEARLTGFPRHDGLRRKVSASNGANLVTFMPTWRRSLAAPHQQGDTMKVVGEGFAESDFARRWSELISAGELRSIAAGSGLELAMMPHPNLAEGFDESLIPGDVHRFSYESDDVQDVLSRTLLVVTDYSSLAFDAAFADRAVLYYQFDRESVFGSGHFYRPGYFSYEEDGFGPVATDSAAALEAISEFVAAGARPPTVYRDRAAATFPYRDENACERVVDSMIEMRRPARSAGSSAQGR